MMRKLTPMVADNNVALVLVQHLTTMIGTMKRDPLDIAGGLAIRYGASIILDYRKQGIGESDPISKEEGVKIKVNVRKNHAVTHRFPYLTTEYYGIFGQGTERYLEALQLAVDAGHLVKAGAFIRVPDENGEAMIVDGIKMQWQGAAKFREHCINNPEFFEELVSKIEGKAERMSDEEVAEIKAIEAKEGYSEDEKPKKTKGKKGE